jgi:predicted transglutaminase-like cysteine proteinase
MINYRRPSAEVLLACILIFSTLFAAEKVRLSNQLLSLSEQRYGTPARERLLDWESLLNSNAFSTELEKLEKVNEFFNRIPQIDDIEHWQRQNYWATPTELLASGGGDCEDFALAKYFTLRHLGVADEKLQITYVKIFLPKSGSIRSHMVLSYYATAESDPLILDNLVTDVLPALRRRDLTPVYGFNGTGLWLARERKQGRQVESIDEFSLWNDLLERMDVDEPGFRPYESKSERQP